MEQTLQAFVSDYLGKIGVPESARLFESGIKGIDPHLIAVNVKRSFLLQWWAANWDEYEKWAKEKNIECKIQEQPNRSNQQQVPHNQEFGLPPQINNGESSLNLGDILDDFELPNDPAIPFLHWTELEGMGLPDDTFNDPQGTLNDPANHEHDNQGAMVPFIGRPRRPRRRPTYHGDFEYSYRG